jgi:hypothetical protein
VSSYWDKLSTRERRLIVITVSVVASALLMMIVTRAVAHVRELDHTVARLEQELLSCAELNASGVSVDKAFEEVAAQHSSAWTENEIHNRLRQEIYRLAQEDPEAPPGGDAKKLVDIPMLRQGTLKEGGAGYREYQLNIKIPSSDVYSVVIFLIRLLKSPQSLRIDSLELARSPDSHLISVNINVTRTVVAGAPKNESDAATTRPATVAAWDGSKVEDWHVKGCDLALVSEVGDLAAGGGSCLKAQANMADATVFMWHDLDAGMTYELEADMAATGKALLEVVDDAGGTPFEGAQSLADDGKPYRYRMRFTVPGAGTGRVKLRVPTVALEGPGTLVYVDNVMLKKLAE